MSYLATISVRMKLTKKQNFGQKSHFNLVLSTYKVFVEKN